MSKSLTDVYGEIIETQAREELIIPILRAFGNEIRLATIEECSEIVSTTRDRGDACRKLLNLALSRPEDKS